MSSFQHEFSVKDPQRNQNIGEAKSNNFDLISQLSIPKTE